MGNLICRDIKFVVPAEKGWHGLFSQYPRQKYDAVGKQIFSKVPVVAWIYAEYAEAGPDFDTIDGTWMWSAIGIWTDGPSDMGSFVNFTGFGNDNDEAWGNRT